MRFRCSLYFTASNSASLFVRRLHTFLGWIGWLIDWLIHSFIHSCMHACIHSFAFIYVVTLYNNYTTVCTRIVIHMHDIQKQQRSKSFFVRPVWKCRPTLSLTRPTCCFCLLEAGTPKQPWKSTRRKSWASYILVRRHFSARHIFELIFDVVYYSHFFRGSRLTRVATKSRYPADPMRLP